MARPITRTPPPEIPGDPRSKKTVLPDGTWIESVETPLESLAYLDEVPEGFAKIRAEDGSIGLVALSGHRNPLHKLASEGRRRLTQNQIDAGLRLQQDFQKRYASTSNTAAICDTLASSPDTLALREGRQAIKLAERLGTGYQRMKLAPGVSQPKDYAHMRLDSALMITLIQHRMSRVGWRMVELLCGLEWTAEQIAAHHDESRDYVIARLGEALSELGRAYRMIDNEARKARVQ